MTALKSLPARPSQESLRKQAKKLAHEIAAGNEAAIARARAQLDKPDLLLSQRDAQLVIAREYGYASWLELLAEVHRRLGQSVEWAAAQAHRLIHDDDVEGLKRLVIEYPALLSWKSELGKGGLLGWATASFGDSGDPERERQFTRPACAEFLIDAGAVVLPVVCDALVHARAKGLLQLFERKHLLPRTLKFLVALGDIGQVRASITAGDENVASLGEAFSSACHFENMRIASFLLDQIIALDGELGTRIDQGPGREAFIGLLIKEHDALAFMHATPEGPWQTFVMHQVVRALHDDDFTTFTRAFEREPWLLDDSCVGFQVGLIERATLRDRQPFITALLDLDPALLRRRPLPRSQAIEFVFTYAKTNLLPALTRVWPLPDDLAHAAGIGDLDRVKKWFDASGKPALGDLANHFPCNSAYVRSNLQWGEPHEQQVLDTALAWAVINRHLDVADILLQHGADINTRWSSHEPASILHELVSHNYYEGMQFLIDRGIDMTITDYRWGGTAQGWAYHAAKNAQMADWLGEAEQRQVRRVGLQND